MSESNTVRWDTVKGVEGKEGVPDRGGPEPWLGREASIAVEGQEDRVEDEHKGAKVVGGARGPDMVKGESRSALTELSECQTTMPCVTDGEGGCNVFV